MPPPPPNQAGKPLPSLTASTDRAGTAVVGADEPASRQRRKQAGKAGVGAESRRRIKGRAPTALRCEAAGALAIRYRRPLARCIAAAGIGLPLVVCACFWLLQTATLRLGAPWYGVWLVLALALLAGALVAPLRQARLVFYAFVLAAIFRGALHTERGLTNKLLIETEAIRAASWIRGQLAEGEPIGSWNAGVVAYYCDCNVVNLDGLVNDYAFYREVIQSERMPAYLAREHIHWLVDNILSRESYARPMFGLTSEQLAQQPMTLVQSFCRVNEPACDGFGAWRLSP